MSPATRHPIQSAILHEYCASWRASALALPGGSLVDLRPVTRDDTLHLSSLFAGLSKTSRWSRFWGPKQRLSKEDLAYLAELDGENHFAVLAFDSATGKPVGVARLVRLTDAVHTADVAVTVIDAWQRRGLGRLLFEHLAAAGRERALRWFQLDVLSSNVAMRTIVTGAARGGPRAVITMHESMGVVTLKVPL